jgi:hypothetical protein
MVSSGDKFEIHECATSVPEKQYIAAFAKALARSEFGRFYWDDSHESEVKRSLASAMARIKQERRARAKLAKQKR